jgi:predicted MFS family arabinose efflux permease
LIPRRWAVFTVLFAGRAITGFQFQSVGSAGPDMAQQLHLSFAEFGLLLGSYLFPGMLIALPTGLVARHISDRAMAVAGLGLMLVSGLMSAAAYHFELALAARLLGGIGATVVALVVTKLTMDWFGGREIAVAMSLLQLSWPFGAMIALPIQAVIVVHFGWSAVMQASAALAVVVLVGVMLMPAKPVAEATAGPKTALPHHKRIPVVIAGLMFGALNAACVLFFTFAPGNLIADGYSSTDAASLTGLALWLTIVAIPAGGYLLAREGRSIPAIVIGALLGASALLAAGLQMAPVAAGLLFGVAAGAISGAILLLPNPILQPAERAAGLGVFYTCSYLVMTLVPVVTGWLQDLWPSSALPLVAATSTLAAVPCLALGLVLHGSWRAAGPLKSGREIFS